MQHPQIVTVICDIQNSHEPVSGKCPIRIDPVSFEILRLGHVLDVTRERHVGRLSHIGWVGVELFGHGTLAGEAALI